jgi:hypothetical protein
MMVIAIAAPTFIAGAIVGAIALICASINREDSYKSLMLSPPTRAAATTRRIVGWHGATPQNTIPLHRMAQPTAARFSR